MTLAVFLIAFLTHTLSPNAVSALPGRLEKTSDNYFILLPRIGAALHPNISVDNELWFGEKLIYRARYTSDQFGRRVVPMKHRNQRNRFVLFSGCSNIFGEGINDEETVPANIARLAPGLMPYNYAFRGYGPHQLLAILQTRNLRKEIQEDEGLLIYHYYDFHRERVLGSAYTFSWTQGSHPYFYFGKDGKLRNEQTFAEAMPRRVKWMPLVWRYLSKVFPGYDFLARPFWEDGEKLVCEIFKEARNEFKKQFPNSKFLVVINPIRVERKPEETDGLIRDCFIPLDIAFFDLRKHITQFPANETSRLPYDGHLTSVGAERLSKLILPEIEKQLEGPNHR